MNISRDWNKNICKITIEKKIEDMDDKFQVSESMKRVRKVPMAMKDYIVKPDQLDELPDDQSRY